MALTNTFFTYCTEDQHTIDVVVKDLAEKGVNLTHDLRKENLQRSVRQQMREQKKPVWLFISDEFLRSSEGMNNVLSFLEDPVLSVYIQPVVIGQLKSDQEYIDFWKNEYRSIRARKDQIPPLELETYNWRVIIIRSIQNEIADFLGHLKTFKIISFEEFKQDDYLYFYDVQGVAAPIEKKEEPEVVPAPTPEPEPTLPTPVEVAIEKTVPIEEVEAPAITPVEQPILPKTEEPAIVLEPENEQLPEGIEESFELLPIELIDEPEEQTATKEKEEAPPVSITEPQVSYENLLKEDELDEEFEEETPTKPTILLTYAEQESIFRKSLKKIRKGKPLSALKGLSKILESLPNDPQANYYYGMLHQDVVGDREIAFEHLERVILHSKGNDDAYIRLAQIAEENDDAFLAKNYLEKAASLDTENPQTLYQLGLLLKHHFPLQQDKALSYFEKAIILAPGQAEFHYQYGQLLLEMNSVKKAQRELTLATRLDENHLLAYYELAKTQLFLDKPKKARKFYLKACKNNRHLKTAFNDQFFGIISDKDLTTKEKKKRPTKGHETPNTKKSFMKTKEPKKNQENIAKSNKKNTDKAVKGKQSKKKKIKKQETKKSDSREPDGASLIEALKEYKKKKTKKTHNPLAFITGATSGIGQATAHELAKLNYHLIISGRRKERLEALKSTLEQAYDIKVKTLTFDVRNEEAVKAAIHSLSKKWSNIDLLINNAGLAKGFEPIQEGNTEDWDLMIDTNVKGLLYVTRVIVPNMVKRKSGHIINISSVAGKEVYPKGGVYCASKHAVEAITKGLRIDLLEHGIRVSSVAPGHVETEFAQVRYEGNEDKIRQAYQGFTPLSAKDIAETIVFIATRPPNVNVQDVLLFNVRQANATIINRQTEE